MQNENIISSAFFFLPDYQFDLDELIKDVKFYYKCLCGCSSLLKNKTFIFLFFFSLCSITPKKLKPFLFFDILQPFILNNLRMLQNIETLATGNIRHNFFLSSSKTSKYGGKKKIPYLGEIIFS